MASALALAHLTGFSVLVAVRSRWPVSALLFATPVVSLPLWAVGTRLSFATGLTGAPRVWPAFLAACLTLWVGWRRRSLLLEARERDLWALGWAVLVSVPVVAVFLRNGLQPGGRYLARSWFGRDSFYLFSFAQMTLETAGPPDRNPFLAGAQNHYPTLAHVGLAGLTLESGQVAAVFVPALAVTLCIAGAGLSFLWISERSPSRRGALALGALGALGWMAARPDLIVYPHTQAVVFAVLLLVLWLSFPPRGRAETGLILFLSGYLVFAHALTAAVALSALGVIAVEEWRPGGSRRRAAVYLGAALVLGLVFLGINAPARPALTGAPTSASLTATIRYAAPWIPAAGAALLLSLGARRSRGPWVLPLGPLLFAVAYYTWGALLVLPAQRFLVLVNAERLVHYALLCALALLPDAGRRRAALAIGLVWVGLSTTPSIRLIPGLLWAPPLELSRADLAMFEAVREKTPASATIFSLTRNFGLPAFTGRTQNAVEPLDWSMGGLPAGEVERYWNELVRFDRLAPSERRSLLARRGYSHLLVPKPQPGASGSSLLDAWLPEGSARTVYEDRRYVLYALEP
jgi:hypothetical protein